MKKEEKKKLYGKGLKELESILSKLQDELVNLKIGKATKDRKDMHIPFKKRKEIAVVKTIIREKILQGEEK